MGCEATEKDLEYNKSLIDSVIHNDVMVDKLIIKDVQVRFFLNNFLHLMRNDAFRSFCETQINFSNQIQNVTFSQENYLDLSGVFLHCIEKYYFFF